MSFLCQILRSFQLDWTFLRHSSQPATYKIQFLKEKYRIKLKHFFRPYKIGSSYAVIENQKIYYESKYGLSGFQSLLARDQYLIRENFAFANTIVDVGANVGFFAIATRQIFPNAKIYCLEPIKAIFDCLKKNMLNSSKTKLFNVAVSDRAGELKMEYDPFDTVLAKISTNKGPGINVHAVTLDQFIEKNSISKIDILKIDTETYEAHVLRGATKALSITKYLYIELTVKDNPNYTISSLMSLLKDEKYDFQIVSFRNYDGKSMGPVRIFDCLMRNKMLI